MKVEFPEIIADSLFTPSRYKIYYGGRGSSKSWCCARALLLKGLTEKKLILCGREFQSSIADSVHALLSQQIDLLGLHGFYEIQKATITGQNGTQFIFAGLRHNVNKIKSTEGVDIAWVEEAQTVSKASWDILIPTIRKEHSEIWITFNPELDTDETYKRFVLTPPSTAIVQKINWTDNPWFPDVLRQEKDDLKVRDEDAYLNVWEGNCRQTLEGAVYANEMRDALQKERITKVPYNAAKPVNVFFDLGWSDCTSLWFVQRVGFELRVLHAYQNRQQALPFYLQYIQSRGYVIDTLYLPHDARAKQLGTGTSIEEMVRKSGFKVKIVPMLSVEDGINALRTMFPTMYFDENECADGLQALRRYCYDVDSITGQFSKKPKHDSSSHFADAARYIAVGLSDKGEKPKMKTIEVSKYSPQHTGSSWMGR